MLRQRGDRPVRLGERENEVMRNGWAGFVALAAWCAAGAAGAQAPAAPAEKTGSAEAAAADPELVQIALNDGSLISGKLSVKQIEVETSFGKLTIPVTSIRSFTPGLGRRPEVGVQVGQWIEQLGSVDFTQRETAQRELAKLGATIRPELEKRQDDKDTERRNRVKALLAELDDAEGADDDQTGIVRQERDVVETTEFTVVGSILTSEFTIHSRYGSLTAKLADIQRAQRDAGRKPDVRKSFAVEGTNLVQRGLRNSSVRLEKGDRVTITADGQLMMTPWGNAAVSGPDGAANYGWYLPNTIPSGALVGAIGAGGKVFKVGSKLTFTADRSGELHLAVAMQNEMANNNFPGRYTARIRVERK